jgi:hypothetical protein
VVSLESLKTWLVKHVMSPMDRVSFASPVVACG